MAHIVLITSGIASISNANFELARRLLLAGHRVTYASPDPIRQAAEAQGLPFVQLRAATAGAFTGSTKRGAAKAIAWAAQWATRGKRLRQAVAALGMEHFQAAIRALAPNLLLVDIELHAAVIGAVASGVPVALLSTWIALEKRAMVPPLHTDIVPGRGWMGTRLGIEAAWLRYRSWKWVQLQLQSLRAAGVSPTIVLRRYAAQVGFPFTSEVDFFQWLLPFSYRSLPVLCLNAYELDLPHEPRPHYSYVGPMVQARRQEAGIAHDPPALDSLLAEHAALGSTRPLIYCAFGAFFQGDDADFVRRVIAAVAARPEWDVVVGLGGRNTTADLGPLPDHVRVYPWVPQLRVLERADCAVIHGGISTLNECVHFGVPMLAYPFKQTTDQMGNAARIAYHGLGIVADRDADTPERIRAQIERLLQDPSYRAAVRRMRMAAQRYADERRAETYIARLLEAPTRREPRS